MNGQQEQGGVFTGESSKTNKAPEVTTKEGWVLFVDNLSRRIHRSTLMELFSHYGRVRRMFIPVINNRTKYKSSTFAFVTVADRSELERCIRFLDNSVIDGLRVKVSKARYPKALDTHQSRGKPNDGKAKNHREQKDNRNGVFRNVERMSKPFNGGTEWKSYKEVLMSTSHGLNNRKEKIEECEDPKRNSKTKEGCLDIDLQMEDSEWMNQCLVGVLKPTFEIGLVQQALLHEKIEVKISKWGSDCEVYILKFASNQKMTEIWQAKNEAVWYWFDLVTPLLKDGIPHQIFSVLLYGVPLTCWHDNFFTALGKQWGEVLGLDSSTSKKDRFDIARLWIRTTSQSIFPQSVKVSSLGINYCIKVEVGNLSDDPVVQEKEFDDDVSVHDEWPDPPCGGRDFTTPADDPDRCPEFGGGDKTASNNNVPAHVADTNEAINCSSFPRELNPTMPDAHIMLSRGPQEGILNITSDNSTGEEMDNTLSNNCVGLNEISCDGFGPIARNSDGAIASNRENEVSPTRRQNSIRGTTGAEVEMQSYSGIAPSNCQAAEFVPDSLNGGSQTQGVIQPHDHSKQEVRQEMAIIHKPNGFLRASNRRILMRVIRASIEENDEVPANRAVEGDFKPEEILIREEAEEVWKITQMLEFFFKGGKSAVIKKVSELERELRKEV
ncbi:hypothetical protein HRI_002043500 [Hibiscus trionum]|uniref:RRM domain-containing protein n=1 Tax=Hibiscus trionum TaxID=183268 RepID=A0A9W7HVK2_HIBTR|nr:hypothetical protein HRI_002043500 [Hibiscus trionum]